MRKFLVLRLLPLSMAVYIFLGAVVSQAFGQTDDPDVPASTAFDTAFDQKQDPDVPADNPSDRKKDLEVPAGNPSDQKKVDLEVPAVIMEGFHAYKNQGMEAAFNTWIKGSPLERNKKEVLSTWMNVFKTFEDYYGAFRAYHVSYVSSLSESTKFIYVIMDYEIAPIFAKFIAFKAEKGWIIYQFYINPDIDKVWPGFLLEMGQ